MGLECMEKAEGGGARVSMRGGDGGSSLIVVWRVGGAGAGPRRRAGGTGSIWGIWWSCRVKWIGGGLAGSLGFATRMESSK